MDFDLESFYLKLRIQEYIKEHANLVNNLKLYFDIYLIGGTIRDLILNKEPKDLDFVVMGNQYKSKILEAFAKFGIDYKLNKFGGFKFVYKDKEIDLWTTDDFFSSIEYNVDGLLYNLNTGDFLSLTFDDFKKNGLRKIKEDNNINDNRVVKLKKFEKEYFKK